MVGFGLTGLWVLIPLMGQTGSSRVAVPKAGAAVEQNLQSLDSTGNPSGAPGSAIDLSMDGALKKKKSDEPVTSSLYQAQEGAAPGAPISDEGALAASPNLASALKAVSKSDPTGWGGAKPQRGFNAPKGKFGALSGMGGSSSGGSGASMSGSPFNSPTAKVSIEEAGGAGKAAAAQSDGRSYMRSVRLAEAKSTAASKLSSGDGARTGAGSSFDGSGASGRTIGSASKDIVFGQFDHGSAPVNLKKKSGGGALMDPEDPDLDKIAQAIEGLKGEEVKADYRDQMGQQMGQMVMMMVVGGVMNQAVGGTAGAMLTMYAMQSMQMLNQNNVK
ncbi:MAG: hypothetical protein HY748_04770 [Elusimicrobia bacterium]|nr:hypothetical protein [Elusimicrobiota bacterium]